ncbi:hypothetical protein GCM10011490_17370 [Pseudoclavibacter endophyticus]|uniref:Uncharacterized protein n=1 Tax=Pseudoclavibacter endophyticus TaxID=1778590 RepID=A0A6H9WRE8_9MICO|nr:hypothetical protein [Pseudoclavibacter endophyticus]KAB1648910.1 hypothetical protein F8O04_00980 [Pseudoclavibacter endophyticus]GGA67323.1 hypothetical protein GCM10011490_17370 [Pseudoclavibacter endophyticus]
MHPRATLTSSDCDARRHVTASVAFAVAVLLLTLAAAPPDTAPRLSAPGHAVSQAVAPVHSSVGAHPAPARGPADGPGRDDIGLVRVSEQLRDAASQLMLACETLVERFAH